MATWMKMNLQNANTNNMEQLIFFHDHIIMILLMVTILIIYMMVKIMTNKMINKMLFHGQMIESIWTILPMFVLIIITAPSIKIMYMMEEIINPQMTIKSIGHQWYWSYEYSDFNKMEFDSFMMQENSMNQMRLMDVDNRLITPMNTQIRMIVTSNDVIHSWTIPSMGIKMDAIPGRMNQSLMNMIRPGMFIGQCSEICGANHSFMPIIMESINMNKFIKWMMTN
uniref:cytochrome c oxidase subunit 2 n=1 Tax=Pycnogonum diceros TaxID=373309 RepID=UPI00226C7A0B|nr:cytochrome c oxidase subunit 2 [Pycnogonum diceros]UZA61224.1 cytochrome c oxidase subunit 2 [Pycnogonum diceros]